MTKAKNESEEVLELSKEKFNDIAETVSELHDSMRNKTQQVAEDSVEFVKKYPLHTAVGRKWQNILQESRICYYQLLIL